MDDEAVKKLLVEKCEGLQGCKAVELVTEVAALLAEERQDVPDLPSLIEDLVKEGRLREIEYVLPSMNHRVKSFLLPAGTETKMTCLDVKSCMKRHPATTPEEWEQAELHVASCEKCQRMFADARKYMEQLEAKEKTQKNFDFSVEK